MEMERDLLRMQLKSSVNNRYRAICDLIKEMEYIKKEIKENPYEDKDILLNRANTILEGINRFHNQIAVYNKVDRLLESSAEQANKK